MSDDAWEKPYNLSHKLVKYIKSEDIDCETIEKYWYETFDSIAKYLGFNKKSRKILWGNLVVGNWKKLHKSYREKSFTPEDWLSQLMLEVYYCSDRWSLDYLSRCHWAYRQWQYSRGIYI